MATARTFTTIDAHTAGGALRLVTGGLEVPRGLTLALKARALDRRHENDLLALLREPRGHDGMMLGVLCEPAGEADVAVLFRREHGFVPLPVAGLIAAMTIALERGLVTPRTPGTVRVETGLGAVNLGVGLDEGLVTAVRCSMPPSFVLAGGVPIAVGSRTIPGDIAWGSPFYVIVDSEAAGVVLSRGAMPQLVRLARAITDEVSRTLTLSHPVTGAADGLGGIVFTGPAEGAGAQLRGVAIAPDGFAERAPSGGALAAILAVLHAMGLATEEPFVLEGLAGTTLSGRIIGETHTGELPAVRVSIAGRGWITGEHRWTIDVQDPLSTGFQW